MTDIPIHQTIQQSDFGIFAKEVSAFSPKQPVDYAHRDNYYIFAMMVSGKCRFSLDFKEYHLSEGDILCIQPNQVHQIIEAGDAKAFLLFIDEVFIDSLIKQTLAEYALSPIPFKSNDIQYSELNQLFSMVLYRIDEKESNESKHILQNLSCAVVGIITDSIRKIARQQPKNRRHIEITLAFKELISKEKQINRKVSHYAESLHISSVYLNEVIKDITGVSVSRFIQNEVVLRAKRMLVYTSLNIKEIADRLGIDDYAYFTRLFSKVAGMSPTSYRKKYLE